ncbi:hypothetical protein LAV_00010 [Sphingobium phage Lacusarx]|uniref:Uncharacterized protein n=1 Tax=Sphingobium phage Lacusarx TaxID=1980139 RepID=A0A1W6DWL5_9CAUD|nr:hypothetical protein FDH44_gp010 [Sphingobium phage Lacusarx]ARK07410.1 hypothetical protein LAV_00010 [Sphingobium phage Lacusarx]
MSDLHVIYSPKNEKFEVSRLNFLDLQKVKGWTLQPKTDTAIGAAEAAKEAPVTPVTPKVPEVAEKPAEAPAAPETTPAADEPVKVRLTVEDFDDLADKDAVKAYIEAAFPGTKIDGRANREKLVAQAVGLAEDAAA